MSEWKPIESAPRDGTEFQAWVKSSYHKGWWEPKVRFDRDNLRFEIWGRVDYDEDNFDFYPDTKLTHWMPQPTPPLDK
ncbi:hypothetical protein [uncultured Limnobacter sp.]|uniref:hypothetical protein n=1 Tax=uncultured Limnobacter sp. TaxID=199681 RepID=UPI0030F5DC3C